MRAELTAIFAKLTRITFGATVVLIPFRFRFVLAARPLAPIYGDYTDILLFASDIPLIATLAFWLLQLALEPRRLSLKPVFLSAPLAGVIGMGIVSIAFSTDALVSGYHAIRLLLLAGMYLYVLNEIHSLGEIILPVTLQVFIQATVGLGQILQQHSLGLSFLGELELDPAWSGVSVVWAEGTRSLRAYGLSDHPNILGGCFAFALTLIAAWFVEAESRWRALVGSVFALGAVGLLLTFSRAAWLAMGTGLVLSAALLLRTRQRRAFRDWVILLGAGLILVSPFAWQNINYLGVRLNQQKSSAEVAAENRSTTERNTLNEAANQVFADHAVTGVGLGAFPYALRDAFPDFPFYYQPAHIVLLDVAAETGIFGGLFYSIVIAAPWLALWLNRRRLKFSPHLIGVSAALMAVTVVGFFDYYPWLLAPGRLWQWLIWGLWAAIYRASFDINH